MSTTQRLISLKYTLFFQFYTQTSLVWSPHKRDSPGTCMGY